MKKAFLMKTQIKTHTLLIIFLFCLPGATSTIAQVIDQIPNQPDFDYYWWKDRSNENLYFLKYSDAGTPSSFNAYAFDGNDFDLIFDEESLNKVYLGAFTYRDYFASWLQGTNILYEYDGLQVVEYELDESYMTFIHLATFNDKIYFAGRSSIDLNHKIIAFDGSEMVTTTIPGTLLGENNYYFSEFQNKVFFRFELASSENELWSYDGDSYSLIPDDSSYKLAKFELEFNNQLIMSYFEPNTTPLNFHLQKYDGSNLSPINSPENMFFYDIIEAKENNLFLRFEDIDTGDRSLYKYDGSTLSPISTSPEIEVYQYAGELDGNDYFITYQFDTTLSTLYSYNGNEFTEIPGPPEFSAFYPAGSLGNKLFIVYKDLEDKNNLAEYIVGSSEVTLVPNMPENLEIKWFIASLPETLFYSFESDTGHVSLFGLNNSGFIEFEFPDTFQLNQYEFTIDNKAYFSYFSDVLDKVKLFRIDGTLNTIEIEQVNRNILIYPNPTNDYFNIHINNIDELQYLEVSLFTTEGKQIDKKFYNQVNLKENILYNVDFLNSGIYILEIKSNKESIQRKVIKR